jgi:hypothetical protein
MDIPAPPVDPIITEPPTPAKRGFFTAQNGRFYALAGIEARKARANAPRPPVETDSQIYSKALILRVREHIERLNDMLAKAKDSGDIDRLSRALERLAKTERELDGRPLPGAYRPERERSAPRAKIEPV